MTKIATYTVGAGGVSAFTFSNIPQTYTDLVIKASARTSTTGSQRNATDISVQFNGNGSGYSSKILTGNALVDNPPISVSNSGSSIVWGLEVPNADATATIFSNSDTYIPNYTSSHYKGTSTDSVTENNSSNSEVRFSVGLWENTAPITSITLTTGVLVQHSTFTLYGIKAMRTAVGNSIKATGGAISFDGTHVYHTYGSTSTFLPTTNVMADVLVIAGGGGSSHGGGGAGGLLYYSAQTLTPQSYVITVGAGGAAGVSASANGSNGSNSQFGSLTACVGGGGGAQYGSSGVFVGNSGGSGGGGGARDTNSQGNGGERVAGQGNTGGFASDALTPGAVNGGGGGGIGSAGGVATNTNDARGNAGAGTAAYSAWGLATGTGHNVGGTVYYAAGGRGSRNFNYGTSENGSAGLTGRPTTGGGADANTAVGGSGVVIIRYKA
jgi:hypothetical protein